MLLASAVPAKVAEVEEIAVAVAPDKNGEIPREMLAVAAELELSELYAMSPVSALALKLAIASRAQRSNRAISISRRTGMDPLFRLNTC